MKPSRTARFPGMPRPPTSVRRAVRPAVRIGPGFTLVELLVVMGVMIVLLGLIVPAFSTISQSNSLDLAGQDVASALNAARDQAMASNRKAYVRLVDLQDGSSASRYYRAVQLWIVKDDAGTIVPLGKVINFPVGIVLSPSTSLSPLLQSPPAQTGKMSIAGTNANYFSFAFTANGTPDPSITSANSFLTLVRIQDATSATAPANFFSLFINPGTGEVTSYRP